MMQPKFLTDLSLEECVALSREKGQQPFHGKILYQWIYKKGARTLAEMTDLSTTFRGELEREYTLFRLKRIRKSESRDGTVKVLYELPDGHRIESVRIPHEERVTLCISSQVGCSIGCRFCASGLRGLDRNLTPGEMVEQVLLTGGIRKRDFTNIVFMGIGEPLLNLDNLSKAIRIINSPEGLGFGARRITVSTVGLPQGIRRLAELGIQINLAISLHAADPEKRKSLIPLAEKVTLEEVLDAADYFRSRTTRDVTYEVLLIKGINDGPEDARKLAALLKGRKGSVNLIPFNRVEGLPYTPPSRRGVLEFRNILEQAYVPVSMRRSRGADIDAACGQLRLKNPDKT